MKFALACWGSRGDVEPCVAVGRELLRRGHDVRMAVPPDLIGFAESAGLAAVGYGPDAQAIVDAYRDFWMSFFGGFWNFRELSRLASEIGDPLTDCREEMSTTLLSLAAGADLLFTGTNYEDVAADVAELHDIPLATLHWYPLRPHSQLLQFLPAPLGRWAMTMFWWLHWRMTRHVTDAQRRELGLAKATGPSSRRITERGSLEIQSYDEACFPGLAAEWAEFDGQRPIVGALTMELPTAADEEVAAWIAGGTPPIFFGFGSMPIASPADTLAMISEACAQLGERALVCAGWSGFSQVPHLEHVKVVATMNYAAALPNCRAVVHHGGTGTTGAGLRAGAPTLILWMTADQAVWASRVKRLKVGTARRFSRTTQETLIKDLRRILAPEYVARARGMATRMTSPALGVATATDHVENFARLSRVDI